MTDIVNEKLLVAVRHVYVSNNECVIYSGQNLNYAIAMVQLHLSWSCLGAAGALQSMRARYGLTWRSLAALCSPVATSPFAMIGSKWSGGVPKDLWYDREAWAYSTSSRCGAK